MNPSINIDDILNANDSDEEHEVGAIDLEQLLDDVDSDDESDSDEDDKESDTPSGGIDVDNMPDFDDDEGDDNLPPPVALSETNKGISDLLAALASPAANAASSPRPEVSEDNIAKDIKDDQRAGYTLPDSSTLTYGLDKVKQDELKQLHAGNRELISPLSSRITSTTSHDVHLKSSKLSLISSQLARNAQFSQHGPGNVTVVKVTTKYIIFGTSRGLILMFDHTEKIKIVLGSTTPSSTVTPTVKNVAITALDVNHTMDIIYCGYDNGEIAVWDVAKNSVLKRITDLHYDRILRLYIVYNVDEDFLSAAAPEFALVSVDVKGIVNKIKISKVLWSYNVTYDCLLDSSAGVIMECVPLYPLAQQLPSLKAYQLENYACSVKDTYLIALNSQQRTYIIELHPTVSVIHKWSAPSSALNTHTPTPTINSQLTINLEWNYVVSDDYPSVARRWILPLLARSWGGCIELLAGRHNENSAKTGEDTTNAHTANAHVKPEFVTVGTIDLDENISVMKWLNGSTLIVLTPGSLYIFNNTVTSMSKMDAETPLATDTSPLLVTSVYSQKLYYLQYASLYMYFLMAWNEQVEQHITNGQWLDALVVIIKKFKNKSNKQYTRNILTTQDVQNYIQRYIDVTIIRQNNHQHDVLVLTVVIDYCIITSSLEYLYSNIYPHLMKMQLHSQFFAALEPFILNHMILSIPIYIIIDMLEYALKFSRIQFFERIFCHLQFEIQEDSLHAPHAASERSSLHYLLSMLRKYKLHMCFAYAYCNIHVAHAYQFMYHDMLLLAKSFPSLEQTNVCYKLMLYLHYAALDQVYPLGTPRSCTIYPLIQLLMSDVFVELPSVFEGEKIFFAEKRYPYLYYLICTDRNVAFHVLNACVKKLLTGTEVVEGGTPLETAAKFYHLLLQCSAYVQTDTATSTVSTFHQHCNAQIVALGTKLHQDVIISVIKNVKNDDNVIIQLLNHQVKYLDEAAIEVLRDILLHHDYYLPCLYLHHPCVLSLISFKKGIHCYLRHRHDAQREQVFAYIKKHLEYIAELQDSSAKPPNTSEYCAVVCSNLVDLSNLNVSETQLIASVYLNTMVSTIISSTKTHQKLQYELLHAIVLSIDVNDLGSYFSASDVHTYIALLCNFSPANVFPFITTIGFYNIDDVLLVCQKNNIYDACAYLYEKMGDFRKGLEVIFVEIQHILSRAKHDCTFTIKHIDQIATVPHYHRFSKVIDYLTSYCVRNSAVSQNMVWFDGLDFLLKEKHTHATLSLFLSHFLKIYIHEMSQKVPPQDVMFRLTQDAHSSQFVDVKEIMLNIIENHDYEISLLEVVLRIAGKDLFEIRSKQMRKQRRGMRSDARGKISGVTIVPSEQYQETVGTKEIHSIAEYMQKAEELMNINYGYAGALLAPRQKMPPVEHKVGPRKPGTMNIKAKFHGAYTS